MSYYGSWKSERLPRRWLDEDFERIIRPTLRVAAELGRPRVFAGGVWWTFTPVPRWRTP